MKFTCTQENLSHGLSLVSRAAGKNVALPILHNVLIQAESGGVKLSTTNLELGLTTTIRAKVEKPGSYTVQSRLISEFISLLGHDHCVIELTDRGLVVTAEKTKTVLRGQPADEFPVLPKIEATASVEVPSQTLHSLLTGVVFAVANDESRPEISGVHLEFKNQALVAAATDSYRLAERQSDLTNQLGEGQSLILPAQSADELLRLLPDDELVKISFSDNQFSCQTKETTLVSRTIEGHYPDYQQIIPAASTTTIKLLKDLFINAVRTASLFCKPGINDVTLKADPDNSAITLIAANTTTGEHQGTVNADVKGQPQTIVFNYRYLLEGLQSIAGDEIELSLQDAQAPGVLRPATKNGSLYLLMPIRQ